MLRNTTTRAFTKVALAAIVGIFASVLVSPTPAAADVGDLEYRNVNSRLCLTESGNYNGARVIQDLCVHYKTWPLTTSLFKITTGTISASHVAMITTATTTVGTWCETASPANAWTWPDSVETMVPASPYGSAGTGPISNGQSGATAKA